MLLSSNNTWRFSCTNSKCIEVQVGADSKCPECGAFSWLKDLKTNRQLAHIVISCEKLRCLIGDSELQVTTTGEVR